MINGPPAHVAHCTRGRPSRSGPKPQSIAGSSTARVDVQTDANPHCNYYKRQWMFCEKVTRIGNLDLNEDQKMMQPKNIDTSHSHTIEPIIGPNNNIWNSLLAMSTTEATRNRSIIQWRMSNVINVSHIIKRHWNFNRLSITQFSIISLLIQTSRIWNANLMDDFFILEIILSHRVSLNCWKTSSYTTRKLSYKNTFVQYESLLATNSNTFRCIRYCPLMRFQLCLKLFLWTTEVTLTHILSLFASK